MLNGELVLIIRGELTKHQKAAGLGEWIKLVCIYTPVRIWRMAWMLGHLLTFFVKPPALDPRRAVKIADAFMRTRPLCVL